MKLLRALFYMGIASLLCLACSTNSELASDEIAVEKPSTESPSIDDDDNPPPEPQLDSEIKILSLGDSYTIGASVCETCRFPEQLKDSIQLKVGDRSTVELDVIARSGWTTGQLKNAIANEDLHQDYDITTLLIGVNNQFTRLPFDTFEKEFPELVVSAMRSCGNKKENVIIISIPDYAFTPFGNGDKLISEELDTYNTFIKNYCNQYSFTYVNITDITRKGFEQPELVASDGLHPSEIAYTQFVGRILPYALEKIGYTTK